MLQRRQFYCFGLDSLEAKEGTRKTDRVTFEGGIQFSGLKKSGVWLCQTKRAGYLRHKGMEVEEMPWEP